VQPAPGRYLGFCCNLEVVFHANITQSGSPLSDRLPNFAEGILNHGRYDLVFLSTTVLTLSFDFDLSKLNSEIWHR